MYREQKGESPFFLVMESDSTLLVKLRVLFELHKTNQDQVADITLFTISAQ